MAEATCDWCGRALGRMEPQYIATLEFRQTIGTLASDEEPGDRDHLLELHEMLERIDDDALADPIETGPCQSEFLLCQDCCRRMRDNPLPREVAVPLDFSTN